MALLARRVIEAARDRHPAFDRRRTPDPSVLRFLSDYRKELAGKITNIDETALAVTLDTPMPLADHDAGIALPANRYLAGVVASDNSTVPVVIPVDLIPWAQRNDRNTPLAAAWEVNGVLYLRSPATVWRNIVSIGVLYVPSMADLSTLDDDIALPEEAARTLTENLAYMMAKRGHSDPSLPVIPASLIQRDAETAESDFLRDIANRNTARHFRTRDVWPLR